MTLAVVLLAVCLLLLFGVAPAMLLLPASLARQRLLLAPFLGLSAGILLTIFLAGLGFPGQRIATVTMVVLATLAAATLLWQRPRSDEWREAWPLWLLGLACVAIIGWPLGIAGHENYWGYANPDQAFFVDIFRFLKDQSFQVPPPILKYRGLTEKKYSEILGMSYFPLMLSQLSGIPVSQLFGVLCAAVAWLVPSAVYLLARGLMDGNRPLALAAAALCLPSGALALTFCLNSLGALSAMAILPAGLFLAWQCWRNPGWRQGAALALVAAGMFYNYYPGAAILALLSAALWVWMLRLGQTPRQAWLWPFLLSLALMSLCFPRQAWRVAARLWMESTQNRLAATWDDEVLLSFSYLLTERLLPAFWGFQFQAPANRLTSPFGPAGIYFLILFGLFCLVLLAARSGGLRRLPVAAPLIAGLVLILYFVLRQNGYGVFKLVTWLSPVYQSAFYLAAIGMARRFYSAGKTYSAVVAAGCAVLFLVLNAANAFRLSLASIAPEKFTSIHNLPGLDYRAFQELEQAPASGRPGSLLAALADPVAQAWAAPFLRPKGVRLLPALQLSAEDSRPRSHPLQLAQPGQDGTTQLLGWRDGRLDFCPPVQGTPIWSNRLFALLPLAAVSDFLTPGDGWYRPERFPAGHPQAGTPFRWLRRRAELLLIHPTQAPKRLSAVVSPGDGANGGTRRVTVFLNGSRLEEFTVDAHCRWVSRPFVAPLAVNQIELLIGEDAGFVPRTAALWNRWVPADARRLNVAVSHVQLLDGAAVQEAPSRFLPADPGQCSRVEHNGIHLDGWLSRRGTVRLWRSKAARYVSLRGRLPGNAGLPLPFRIAARWNGQPLPAMEVASYGPFTAKFPLPAATGAASGQSAEVEIEAPATFQPAKLGTGADARDLSILLEEIALVP